jgi:hypothetical protein
LTAAGLSAASFSVDGCLANDGPASGKPSAVTSVGLTINGAKQQIGIDPRTTLLDALR